MKNSSSQISPPKEYWVGQDLDWDSASVPTVLWVELPFWIMVPNCSQEIEVNGCKLKVEIRDDYIELYVDLVSDSRLSCFYIGPPKINPKLREQIKELQRPVMQRKCKTVLRICSACNKDVLAKAQQTDRRSIAHFYLRSFCEAHLPIIITFCSIIDYSRMTTFLTRLVLGIYLFGILSQRKEL